MNPAPVLALLQARMSSTRLPGKVLLRTCGKPLLQHQIERVRRAAGIDRLVVATSTDPSDDAIAGLCAALDVPIFRGSLDDVLDRFVQGMRPHRPEWVVRLTGDCPLADPDIIDRVIARAKDGGADYVSSALHPTFPDGMDAECVRAAVLEQAWSEAVLPSEREHVTAFVYNRPGRYRLDEVRHGEDLSGLRWTVDEPRDFVFVSQVYEHLYARHPAFGMDDILALVRRMPDLARLNASIPRNEGYEKSLRADAHGAERQDPAP
jgi:spore coat polysaccharide biosynthesis protein SpsF